MEKSFRFISMTLIALLLGPLSYRVEAKRYVVPSDEDVLIEITNGKKESHKLNPNSITVFVWNMYKGNKKTWRRDYLNLTRGKDILLLQEIYLDFQMSSVFFKDREFNYSIATSFIDTKNRDTPTGVGTASKIMPIYSYWQRSPDREPFIRTPKMVMLAEYPIKGTSKTVLTANIHAINFVSNQKLKNMLDQMEDALESHDGPIILGGDFNTWNRKKVKILKKMVSRLGLSEVKFKNDRRMKVLGNIIDYIFTREFDVINSRIYGDIKGSDHKAMEVELKLREI